MTNGDTQPMKMIPLSGRSDILLTISIVQFYFIQAESSCSFPAEIQGHWLGKRTVLMIGETSYNETGLHTNGQSQVVIADCFQNQGNVYLLSSPTDIDGSTFIGYLCWSYVRVNHNVLLIYANISPFPLLPSERKPNISDCPATLNLFPNPPDEDSIGMYYAQHSTPVRCPFIGRHFWNYGCTSGNSTLEICNYPYDTLEDSNLCTDPQDLGKQRNIYKCVASWEGLHGVKFLLVSKENENGAMNNKNNYCYAYKEYSNGVLIGTIQYHQCTAINPFASRRQKQTAVVVQQVPIKENCDIAGRSTLSLPHPTTSYQVVLSVAMVMLQVMG